MKATAIVIADSISDQGIRLTTFQLRYWRAIHSELLTHRLWARNAGSSRARPVKAIIEQVRTEPYGPIHWGENQAGMQASKEIDPSKITRAKFAWFMAAKAAADHAEDMMNMGLHKQVVNRILEPFTYIDVVVTATDYDNFFALRLHKDAQPEIYQLAQVMKEALDASTPKPLNQGEWHLPYIQESELNQDLETLKRTSAARCARVSYKAFDGTVASVEQDLDLFNKLMGGEIKHCFSGDTEVLTKDGFKLWNKVSSSDLLADVCLHTTQFKGFKHPKMLMSNTYTGNLYSIDNKDISFCVTEGHRLIGQFRDKSGFKNTKLTNFIVGEVGPKSAKTYGEREARVPTAPVVPTYSDPMGRVIGFYIGDGYKESNTIAFHFKKARKYQFITNALQEANIPYIERKNSDKTWSIRVVRGEFSETVLDKCKYGSCNKRLGDWDESLYVGIFDGFKNSDGSIKRNTWTYATSSEDLLHDILEKSPLAGVTVSVNKIQRDCFKLMIRTYNYARINDSRRPSTKVRVTHVENVQVYCATMPSGALITRRNGKVLVAGNCSPTEHQATPDKYLVYKWDCPQYHGNFTGWIQFRKTLHGENACKIHTLKPATLPVEAPEFPDRRSMYQHYYDKHKNLASVPLAELWPLFLDELCANMVSTHLAAETLVLQYLHDKAVTSRQDMSLEAWHKYCQVEAFLYNDEHALLLT